jgi:hypothetical protein
MSSKALACSSGLLFVLVLAFSLRLLFSLLVAFESFAVYSMFVFGVSKLSECVQCWWLIEG